MPHGGGGGHGGGHGGRGFGGPGFGGPGFGSPGWGWGGRGWGWGGPGWWGPGWGWGGPGWWGPPPPGFMWWCCGYPSYPPPSMSPEVIVVHSRGDSSNYSTNTSLYPIGNAIILPTDHDHNASPLKEVFTEGYEPGYSQSRFYLTIPTDSKTGQILQVDLNGHAYSVKIPEFVTPGEKVIVVTTSILPAEKAAD